MRALKRWFRRWQAYRAALPQLAACRPHLERALGGPVTWRHTGGRGRDVVCLVERDGRPAGVLRLAHPGAAPSTPAAEGLPFVSLGAADKIEREWQAYSRGAPLGLTPRPLWRDAYALLCAYADARPLTLDAETGQGALLARAAGAAPHVARLHAAGITHMDMSLANILYDRAGHRHLFVDFEYGPAAGLTFGQQCLYDHLRLLESVWKFLTPEERGSAAAIWGGAFLQNASQAVRAADLAPLRPALGRVLAAPELRSFFEQALR